MSKPVSPFVALLALLLIVEPTMAQAQPEPGAASTVAGTGVARLSQKPTLLRMTIQLQEKGETVQEALAKLADRRQAAVLQLQSLQAKQSDIEVSEPTLSAEGNEQMEQMQRMLMQQMRARGRVPKGLVTPKSVTVATALTATWPLVSESNDDLLVFVSELQESIKEADLAGLNEPQELTPEEEELQAEMAEMMSGYEYGEGGAKPGEPAFQYVARITDEQRDQSLAEAFGKAKAQAEMLAGAAGRKLGALTTLGGGVQQLNEDIGYGFGYNSYAMRVALAQGAGELDDSNEATARTPGPITFHFTVNATFHLE